MKFIILLLFTHLFFSPIFGQVASRLSVGNQNSQNSDEKEEDEEEEDKGENTIKIGAGYISHEGAKFTLLSASSNTEVSSSGTLQGLKGFAEYILLSRFAVGYEFGTMSREFDLTFENEKIESKENVTFSSFSFKAYIFEDHFRPGFKFYGGYSIASYDTSVSHNSNLNNLNNSTKTTATVHMFKLGTELAFKSWGMRLDAGLPNGTNIETKDHNDEFYVVFDYGGSTYNLDYYFFF